MFDFLTSQTSDVSSFSLISCFLKITKLLTSINDTESVYVLKFSLRS